MTTVRVGVDMAAPFAYTHANARVIAMAWMIACMVSVGWFLSALVRSLEPAAVTLHELPRDACAIRRAAEKDRQTRDEQAQAAMRSAATARGEALRVCALEGA